MEDFPIDFIITWVDGGDPEWLASKAEYKGEKGDVRNNRYRDWDTLRFLLRSIDTYAPWVNKVFLVTCGHLPKWINLDNPKLRIVKHSDYLPEKYLPTFSSRTIDMNFHRIPELSEHFVYFNDDMLLVDKVEREDFFKNGLPCDTAVLRPAIIKNNKSLDEKTSQMYLAPVIDMSLINKYFPKHRAIRKNFRKWYSLKYGKEIIKTFSLSLWDFFPGIREYHCCYSYLKSTYSDLWKLEEKAFDEVCMHRFRVNTDYNHWVFSYWQMAKGDFAPRNPGFGFAYSLSDLENNKKIFADIYSKKHKMVCLNDSVSDDQFENMLLDVTKRLEKLYPAKSSFEKQ